MPAESKKSVLPAHGSVRFEEMTRRFSECRKLRPGIYQAAAHGLPGFMKICLELMLDDTVNTDEVLDWMAREVRKQLAVHNNAAAAEDLGEILPIERKWAEITVMNAFELFDELVQTLERTTDEAQTLRSIKTLLLVDG